MTTAMLPAPRLERLYGEVVTEQDLVARVDRKYRETVCSDCGGIMTVVKAPVSKDGFQTVTFQCHNPGPTKSGMCLYVIQGTDSARTPMAPLNPTHADTTPYIRPGDLGDGDIGWKDAVPELLPAEAVSGLVAAKKIAPKAAFDGVKVKPEYPAGRVTINKILWDYFFDHILKDGFVIKFDLDHYVKSIKGDEPKVREALKTVPHLIASRSGYSVKLRDGKYEVVGRTVGAKGLLGLPYSDKAYRVAQGFPE